MTVFKEKVIQLALNGILEWVKMLDNYNGENFRIMQHYEKCRLLLLGSASHGNTWINP